MKSETVFSRLIIIITVFNFLSGNAQSKGDSYKDAKKYSKGEWLCIYNETSGYSYKDKNGLMKGYSVELIEQFKNYVLEKEGISITIKYREETAKDFGVFLNHVKVANGGVFGLGGITITDERKKNYKLSIPIMKSVTLIVTHKDVPDFGSLTDLSKSLKGKTGYAVKGTTFEKRLMDIKQQYYPGMEVLNKLPGLDSFEKILNQKNTIQNIDFVGYLSLLKQNMPLKRQPALDMKEETCVVMARDNDWDELFRKFLAEFIGSTAQRKLISDNFGTGALKFLDSVN